MGNLGKLKTPRPKDINFPELKNPAELDCRVISQKSEKEFIRANNICGLKSGNILISYQIFSPYVDESYIEIYSVPQLKLIEKYQFNCETEDEFYAPTFAIQLKNGNIITICEKLYVFNGESISEGPQKLSEEINDIHFNKVRREFFHETDKKFKNPAYVKTRKTYECDFIIEPKEGTLLYTVYRNKEIFHIDIANLDPASKSIYFYKKGSGVNLRTYHLDIIHPSEYYPDYLYICGNDELNDTHNSDLLIFDLNKFCDRGNSPKIPLYTIEISKSQNVFSICEYDKKYLLLDTIKNGIYIIDMESKQKVAVSILRYYIKQFNKYMTADEKGELGGRGKFGYLSRKMIKLKDGRVFIVRSSSARIADIREQVMQEVFLPYITSDFKACALITSEFIASGNYIVSLNLEGGIYVLQIYSN